MRQRASSMYADVVNPPSNGNEKKATLDDMHVEFFKKCDSPNRGLKPGHQRRLPDAEPKPLSDFHKMHEHFKAKLALRNAKQNQLKE